MSFLTDFYSRISGAFSQVDQGETNLPHVANSDSANDNDASSRTLSSDDNDKADVDTPRQRPRLLRSRVPPTPTFAPPATPFGGQPSPAVNHAAAEQLQREAESSIPPSATPFFGVFAPPQTPATTRNMSPVRNQAAELQLVRETLGHVPETPATVQLRTRVTTTTQLKTLATPMTQYKTPAMSGATPIEPSTEQSFTVDVFQTPSVVPTKRQRQNHSSIQEESEMVFEALEPDQVQDEEEGEEEDEEEEEGSEASPVSSPHQALGMDLSSADEGNTSTTSIESSDSEKQRTVSLSVNKTRKNLIRRNQLTVVRRLDDRRTRVQKTTRPRANRNVSGREELLNRARKRFYDRV